MSDITKTLRRERSQKEFEKSFLRADHLQNRSFFQRINWLNCIIVFGIPALAFYGLFMYFNTYSWRVWLWAVIYYFWTGFGITAGIVYT